MAADMCVAYAITHFFSGEKVDENEDGEQDENNEQYEDDERDEEVDKYHGYACE